MAFTETFGGTVIYPSQTSYLALTMASNQELAWPIEQQIGGNIVADIIDINATAPGLTITIPDARQVSTGFTSLFNNVGAQTVTILNATGGTIVSLTSGTAWEIYLTDNSTEAGTWRTFQYGASVSVADAAALAGAGLKAILTTLNQSMPVSTKAVNYVILDADRAKAIVWTSGSGTFTLPNAATVGADWFVIAKNLGSGDLTITPPSGTIDGAASLTLAAGGSAFIDCDGTNYFTVGLGTTTSGSDFGFIEIDVSGSGDYVLSGAELNRIGYRFTGTLTGTRNIVVPLTVQQYWVTNDTTGAFSLFVKTATQSPGIEVQQGDANILYCDGTDVVSANSTTVTFPIAVNQGGTGAITASAARTNLGATTVGSNLFTAANSAAALAVVGGAAAALTLTAGTGLTGGGDLSANRSFALDTANTRNVDHAAVSINAGTGLTGGGDITTSRTLTLDPNYIGQTKITTGDLTTSSSSFSNVTGLTGFTLDASSTYILDGYWAGYFTVTGPNIFFKFNASAGSISASNWATVSVGSAAVFRGAQASAISTSLGISLTGTPQGIGLVRGYVVTGGSGATLDFQFASDGGGSTVLLERGCWMRFTKVT